MEHSIILTWCLIMAIATALVALFHHFRISSVLAYLVSGIVVGPFALGLIESAQTLQFLAELGVILLMFTIGLEFSFSHLVAAKRLILGVGGSQVVLTSLALGVIAVLLGLSLQEAFVLSVALSMSSTPIVLKQLGEQGQLSSPQGRISTGILLFQDIAAVPILVCLPVLAAETTQIGSALGWALVKMTAVFVSLVIFGRFVLPHVLDRIAKLRSLELFMLSALLMALAAAALSHFADLSPTLGAFMAGTLIGETRFKHQIEADIRPFRDLMLGIFFLSIGVQFQPTIFVSQLDAILIILACILLLKAVVLVPIISAFKYRLNEAWQSAVTLAHGGEFSLLVISSAVAVGVLNESLAQSALAATIVSMLLAPLLINFNQPISRVLGATTRKHISESNEADISQYADGFAEHVIVCGYGRLGQNTCKILKDANVSVLALDLDPEKSNAANMAGESVLFANACTPGVLRAAGIQRAKVLAITMSDSEVARRIANLARTVGFEGPILVRSKKGRDEQILNDVDATLFPEGLEASLSFAAQLMLMLDIPLSTVEKQLNTVRTKDYDSLREFYHSSVRVKANEQQENYPVMRLPVAIEDHHHAVGKTLNELALSHCGVDVIDVCRGSMRVPGRLWDSKIKDGDVVVLSGIESALNKAVSKLVEGF